MLSFPIAVKMRVRLLPKVIIGNEAKRNEESLEGTNKNPSFRISIIVSKYHKNKLLPVVVIGNRFGPCPTELRQISNEKHFHRSWVQII